MQCAAVLLLEIAYQGQHTKDNSAEIMSDMQKLILWLHAMQPKDSVAGRAYQVLRKILHNVTPALQSKAAELLTEDIASGTAETESPRLFGPPHRQQQSRADWAQGEFFDGSTSATGHYYSQAMNWNHQDTSQSAYNHLAYGGFPLEEFHISNTFGNPFINHWDEGAPVVDLQNLWYDPSYSSAEIPEDLGDMNLMTTHVVQEDQRQPPDT
jgi:hypothetical protein